MLSFLPPWPQAAAVLHTKVSGLRELSEVRTGLLGKTLEAYA